jgi:hypothetical protein
MLEYYGFLWGVTERNNCVIFLYPFSLSDSLYLVFNRVNFFNKIEIEDFYLGLYNMFLEMTQDFLLLLKVEPFAIKFSSFNVGLRYKIIIDLIPIWLERFP